MITDFANHFIRHAVIETVWNKSLSKRIEWYSFMHTESFELICNVAGLNVEKIRNSDSLYRKRTGHRPYISD